MLPSDLEPRAILGADSVSYSELSSLASCENRWVLQYTGPREPSGATKNMQLGTEIHRLLGAWWGGAWPESEDPTAQWVMERYIRHYGAQVDLTMKQVEAPICFRLPDGTWFFGYADGLVLNELTGEYWNVEFKSAGQLSAAVYLEQQIQQKLYVLAWRSMGINVVGSMLDVLCTTGADKQESKADCYRRLRQANIAAGIKETKAETEERVEAARLTIETPLAESFDRRWLRYSDAELIDALDETRSALARRRDLRSGLMRPMRSVGFNCGSCFQQAPCFGLDVDLAPDASDEAF